jgi:hypothetical protein
MGLAACAICVTSASAPQQRGQQDRGEQGAGNRSRGQQVMPAHRQVVRSSTYVPRGNPRTPQAPPTNPERPRSQVSGNAGGRSQTFNGRPQPPARIGEGPRPTFDHTPTAPGNREFTRTPSGRQYDNGLELRKGTNDTTSWQHKYFPSGHYHYPYYTNSFGRGDYYSPFAFYFGICDPYISGSDCSIYPPSDAFINIPIYDGNMFSGWTDTDNNAFDQPTLNAEEPGLLNATDEISETFQNGNIDALVALIDPNISIAIYTQGKYQYSMKSNDYVDLTRDTIKTVKVVSLNLNYLQQDSPTVYTLSGEEVYVGDDNQNRAVYLSFVLQDIGGQWTLTQVGTSPDRIQDLG